LLHHEGSAVEKTTKVPVETKAKKQRQKKQHMSATVRSCYHSDNIIKLCFEQKVCQMAALMSVTDCFQDVTQYRLPIVSY